MMMIQIEYPALARRNPTTDRRARSDGPVRRTQQNRKEGPKPKPKEHGARALARSPSPTSARRPTDVPPSPSPPSPTASANQRSAANAERRHSAATIAVVRRPKDDRRGEARRPLSPAPRRRGRRRQVETQDGFDSDSQSVRSR